MRDDARDCWRARPGGCAFQFVGTQFRCYANMMGPMVSPKAGA
jgi:hypothetical protein